MIPAKGFYGLKTGSDEFFRYTAPKIVKCQVYESSQKIFLDEMSAPFPSVILESGTAQMPLILFEWIKAPFSWIISNYLSDLTTH